jgi:hypothetical protein
MGQLHMLLLGLSSSSLPPAAQLPSGTTDTCERRIRTQLEAARAVDTTFHLALSGAGAGGAQLRYFGARHTYDSTDAQLPEIEAVWHDLRPTVAFFEGTVTFIGPTRGASVARSAEPGLVRFLAQRDSIPARSLEPEAPDEAHYLLSFFSAEQVVLFYVTRPLTQYRDGARIGGRPFGRAALDSVLPKLLTRVQATAELAGAVLDTAAYRAAFARWFPGLDPLDTPSRWFNPERTSEETGSKFFNDVNRASSAYRDLHMYRLLASAWKPNARIIAVVGRAHIPAQAQALVCALQ